MLIPNLFARNHLRSRLGEDLSAFSLQSARGKKAEMGGGDTWEGLLLLSLAVSILFFISWDSVACVKCKKKKQ